MKKFNEYLFAFIFLIAAAILCHHLIQKKLAEDRMEYFVGEGRSMEPTFYDGDELKVDPAKEPTEGDVIVFRCKSCDIEENTEGIMTKRLRLINKENCYWVEGDNPEVSLDSRDKKIGWLCPQDIELFGVVIEVEK